MMPARTIPVPNTVSPQIQKLIAAPLSPTWNVIPKTPAEWKAQVAAGAAATMKTLPALREKLGVKVEPITIAGVKAYRITPRNIPPENANRLLVHVHGGCYVSGPGESGTSEAIARLHPARSGDRARRSRRRVEKPLDATTS